jgi:hypothetical protein
VNQGTTKYAVRKRVARLAVPGLFLLFISGAIDGKAALSTKVRQPAGAAAGQAPRPGPRPGQRWHPTKFPASTVFVGDQACAECHKSKVMTARPNAMTTAMEPVGESKVLTANPKMSLSIGGYTYQITRRGQESIYTVSDGKQTISLPILYAFGQGKAGQTYVLKQDDIYYESLVSFYNEISGLDLTMGAQSVKPQSLMAAIGRQLSKNEAVSCFGCHSTGAVGGSRLHLDKLVPGVRCEACHGPGTDHVAAGKAGQPNAALIFNPGRLGADELSQEFCASCHRGNEEFSSLKGMEINNVRFQPYRIFHSKCYSDDRRIGCTACHNPHEAVKQDAAYYDAKCMSCHESSAASRNGEQSAPACKVGTKDCSSCHMPKTALPGAHFRFTDHYIRIVRPNERYPN